MSKHPATFVPASSILGKRKEAPAVTVVPQEATSGPACAPLAEVLRGPVHSRWNVLGKATYVSNILPTKGPDLNMRVRLADPSLPTGLLINIFAREKSAFPSASEGAVLCVFQLKLTIFDSAPRGHLCLAKGGSVLVFDGTPVPRSLALVSAAEPRPPTTPPPVPLKRLSELPDSGSVDLVVQVLKAGSPVLVWDGTVRDQLPTCLGHSPPYSWLTLAASDERLQLHLLLLDRCQWVFFPRVELQLQGDRLIGGINEIWQVLAENDPRVQDCRRERHALRAVSCETRCLTTTGHPELPASTLAQVLQHPTVPAIVRCVGLRVVALPTDLREITQPYCRSCDRPGLRDDWGELGIRYTCPRCYHHLGANPPFVYMFLLTLADNVVPTQAWLHALVWKEDGERFLGLPAVNLYNDEGALAQVQTKLKALLAEGATIDCCFRSCRAISNGTTCHRLCDTELVV